MLANIKIHRKEMAPNKLHYGKKITIQNLEQKGRERRNKLFLQADCILGEKIWYDVQQHGFMDQSTLVFS